MKDETCKECGEAWDSEFHMSDECTNINEDKGGKET